MRHAIGHMLAGFILCLGCGGAKAQEPELNPSCPRDNESGPLAPGVRCIGRLTERYAFSVTFPALPRDPAVRAIIAREAAANERRLRDEAGELWSRRAATGDRPPRLGWEQDWAVAVERPEMLVLFGGTQNYWGGAHGGLAYDVLLFDRRAHRRILLRELFTNARAGARAIQIPFCRALLAQVRERRQSPQERIECPAASDSPFVASGAAGGPSGAR